MENSSEALIIAGSVLASIFLVATGVQVYNSTGKASSEQAKQATEKMWDDVDIGLETYAIGEEVIVKKVIEEEIIEEHFYVIGEKINTVLLFSKDCIDIEKIIQSTNAQDVNFSSTKYWSSIEGIEYPYHFIEDGEPISTKYALYYAYKYGAKLGGKGRLLRYDEAKTLVTNYRDIIFGRNGKSNSTALSYWLGSAHSENQVWYVGGWDQGMWNYRYNMNRKVRPVVEISKSLVQKVE